MQACRSAWQLHFQLLLADLVDDPLNESSDSSSSNSSVSDVSDVSSLASSQSNKSSASELMHRLFNHWEKHLKATAEEIQLTRVLQHLPPVPHAPQIQILDDHRVH